MCHLIFFLPVVGIPLFWLLALEYALPINVSLWLLTAFLFWVVRRDMSKPVDDGFQSLVGTKAKIVAKLGNKHSARYQVRCNGELWSAYCTDTLETGEPVNIVGVRGIGLVVERVRD